MKINTLKKTPDNYFPFSGKKSKKYFKNLSQLQKKQI
jgi:hypothetical protein